MKTTDIQDFKDYESRIADLQNSILQKEQTIEEKDRTILYLKEQLAWFQRRLFGKLSERIVSDLNADQLVFEGFDFKDSPQESETPTVTVHKRRKPRRDKQDAIVLPQDLPVETTILDVHPEEKVCKETGEPLVQIGQEVSHRLAHRPGSYYIKEIIRPKYANPKKSEDGITIASLPDSLLPKCRADESFLAEIITQKFADHMPLYRIAERLGRLDIQISRKLLSQWVVRCGLAMKPLYEKMLKCVLQSNNIFIDESPVKLQAKGKCDTAYMWVVVGGNTSDPPYRIYSFQEDRRHEHVLEILQAYRGGLHSDKYAAYQRLAEKKIIIWFPCYSHIRRKFIEAEVGDRVFQSWVLRKLRYLFMLERVAWARSQEERLKIRKEKEEPIIDELIEKIKEKLTDHKILPKSKLRQAIGYFCGLIPYLKNYIHHAFARLDNNVAERAIRPLTIGRKNWLFFGSEDGGEAGAILLSFVQTCRGLGM